MDMAKCVSEEPFITLTVYLRSITFMGPGSLMLICKYEKYEGERRYQLRTIYIYQEKKGKYTPC